MTMQDFNEAAGGEALAEGINRKTIRVAVYGTLKRGESNHRLLSSSVFLGSCSLCEITLYDIGPYPGAKLEPSQGIDVEIFEVTATVFAALDELEDHRPHAPSEGEYHRIEVATSFGLAWLYIFNPSVNGLPRISVGGWPRAKD